MEELENQLPQGGEEEIVEEEELALPDMTDLGGAQLEAIKQANLNNGKYSDVGVIIGSGIGGISTFEITACQHVLHKHNQLELYLYYFI